jgi:hypothetical protein
MLLAAILHGRVDRNENRHIIAAIPENGGADWLRFKIWIGGL